MALTKRQKQVLDFIANFVDENGYCPSFEEIARGLELASLATVHKHISVLEAKNYLKRGFNQSRSLELTPRYVQERSEEHTSELQSLRHLVCRLLLEKKKKNTNNIPHTHAEHLDQSVNNRLCHT